MERHHSDLEEPSKDAACKHRSKRAGFSWVRMSGRDVQAGGAAYTETQSEGRAWMGPK